MSPEPLLLVERDEPIAVVLLNRPKQLNALGRIDGGARRDADRARCRPGNPLHRPRGSERAFAAGADIEELSRTSAIELYYARRIERWDAIRALWTPLVAAVSVSASAAAASWR